MAGRNIWLGSEILYRPDSDDLLRDLGTPLKVETSWVRSLAIAILLTLTLIKFAWLGGDYGYVPARSLVARTIGWVLQFLACISLFALVSVTATQALAARALIRRRGEELTARIQLDRHAPKSSLPVALVEQGVAYFQSLVGRPARGPTRSRHRVRLFTPRDRPGRAGPLDRGIGFSNPGW